MRKVLALLALLAVLACWNGCSKASPDNMKAPDSSKTSPTTTGGSSMNSNSSGNTSKAPSPTGIKPPMKDEKK